jgi:hypothetical protein
MPRAHRQNIFCWGVFFLDNVKWKNYEFLSSHPSSSRQSTFIAEDLLIVLQQLGTETGEVRQNQDRQ